MIFVILIIFLISTIFIIHAFLSMSINKYLGLIIPAVNLIIAIGIPIFLSDFTTAVIIYFLLIIPIIIEYIIYKYYRNKVEHRKINKINKMKIKDL